MTGNIWVEGIELVRVKRIVDEQNKANGYELRNFRHAERDLREQGVMRIWYDENNLMTSDQGAVYSLHGRRYITQAKIDAHYPDARARK